MSNEKIILLDLNVYSKISYAVDNNLIDNDLILDNKKLISDENLLEEINKIKNLDKEGFYISVIPSLVETVNNPSTRKDYFEQKEKFNKILTHFFKKAKHDIDFLDKINTNEYIVSSKKNSKNKIEILDYVRQKLKEDYQNKNKNKLDRLKISQEIIKKIESYQENDKVFYLLIIILIYSKENLIHNILKPFEEDQTYNSFNDLNFIEHYFLFLSFVAKKRFLMTGRKVDIELFTFDKKLNNFSLLIRKSIMKNFDKNLNDFILLNKYGIIPIYDKILDKIPSSVKYGIIPEDIHRKIILTFSFNNRDFYDPSEFKQIVEYFWK